MSYEEMKRLAFGGHVDPTVIAVPSVINHFTPAGLNTFNEGVPQVPTEKDYNGVPLADMEGVAIYRGMDELHRVDAIADEYHKGKYLNGVAKVDGKQKFALRYNVKLNS